MSHNLILIPLTPLLLCLIWCIPRWRETACRLTPLAVLPALLIGLSGAAMHIELPWLLLGSDWLVDDLRRVFLILTALLWGSCSIYARGYMAGDAREKSFHLLWLLTLCGNLGLIISADVVSFYLFFALMTFAGYGLVIHTRSVEALRAGRIYLIMAVAGEALILAGLLLSAAQLLTPGSLLLEEFARANATSTYQNLIIVCLFAGFGVKAGLPLLHMWLPLAHPVAPIPASAVLSGAMVKAGLLGWIFLLPTGMVNLPYWGVSICLIGLLAAFAAALIGVQQQKTKTVLAYSSISQMGLLTTALGAAFIQREIWADLLPVIALFAMHHALTKGVLFLGVGITQYRTRLPMLILATAICLPALSLVGLLSSGSHAKLSLKAALYDDLLPDWLLPAITLSAIATTLLMLRYLWLLSQNVSDNSNSEKSPLPNSMLLGWLFTLAASLTAVYWMPLATEPVYPTGNPGGWLGMLWPVLAAALLAEIARRHWKTLPVPPGDLILPIETLLRQIPIIFRKFQRSTTALHEPVAEHWADYGDRVARYLEHQFENRSLIATYFCLLTLLLSLLLLGAYFV
ncbi:complex I subunit 5 family protein [Nitrincola sp. MINF-07-Sa-05]|uniref:complex I subunit 5 family protein n=1 Tax=Nitrincola salilacus TaxID=3400273 RepID=UPI003917C812